MSRCMRSVAAAGLGWLVLALAVGALYAQPKPEDPTKPEAKTPDGEPDAEKSDHAGKLSDKQQVIAEKFQHLEAVLARMAELTGPTDPRRAALLRKAIAQSKEELIGVQFERLVSLLKEDRLANALEKTSPPRCPTPEKAQ